MPLLNIRGVSCSIAGDHDDNPGIVRRWTEYGPEAVVRFMVNWDNAQDLAAALLGIVTLDDNGGIVRVPPYALPFAPRLRCTGITDERPMTPRLDASGWVYYEKSELSAIFSALTWQVEPDDHYGQNDPSGLPYTTTKVRVSSEVVSPPSGCYYIAPFGPTASLASEAHIGIVRPHVEITLVRHWQPRIPLDEAMTLIGIVNDGTVTLANRTFPRGTILFAGMSSDPRNDSNGYPVQELEYSFLGNYTAEWNEFLGIDGEYHFLNTKPDGTGEFPYEYGDFGNVFT